jgi:hypothetical protein
MTASPYVALVGVDFSPESDVAVLHALRLGSLGAVLHFVTVVDPRQTHRSMPIGRARNAMVDVKNALVDRVRCFDAAAGSRSEELRFHVRVGDAASQLHQLAFDVGAELVIVGAGSAEPSGPGLRSVGRTLAVESRFSLLVARTHDTRGLVRGAEPAPADAPEPFVVAPSDVLHSARHLIYRSFALDDENDEPTD